MAGWGREYLADALPAVIGAGYGAYRFLGPQPEGADPAHSHYGLAGATLLGGAAGAVLKKPVSKGVEYLTNRPLSALAEYSTRGQAVKRLNSVIAAPKTDPLARITAQVELDRLTLPDATGKIMGDDMVAETLKGYSGLANPALTALVAGGLAAPVAHAGANVGRAYGEEKAPTLRTHWDSFLGRPRGYERLSSPVRALMPTVQQESTLGQHVALPLAGGAVLAGGLLAARALNDPNAKQASVDRRSRLLAQRMHASGGV